MGLDRLLPRDVKYVVKRLWRHDVYMHEFRELSPELLRPGKFSYLYGTNRWGNPAPKSSFEYLVFCQDPLLATPELTEMITGTWRVFMRQYDIEIVGAESLAGGGFVGLTAYKRVMRNGKKRRESSKGATIKVKNDLEKFQEQERIEMEDFRDKSKKKTYRVFQEVVNFSV